MYYKKQFLAFLLISICFSFLFSITPNRTVNVAFVPIKGMQNINTNNNMSGYMFEYMNQLALRSNWNCKFIPTNWSDAVAGIQNGSIDIMLMVPKEIDINNKLFYSPYSVCFSDASIFSRKGDIRYFYQDPASINNSTIALLHRSMIETQIDEYCKLNNITVQKKYYQSHEGIIDALKSNEVDLAATISYVQEPDKEIIEILPSKELYICCNKENTQLSKEITESLQDLFTINPGYNNSLKEQYFSNRNLKKIKYTKKEYIYLQSNPVIKTFYKSDWMPLEYTNNDGEFSGAIRNIFDLISSLSGLKFEYIPAKNNQEIINNIQEGGPYLITSFENAFSWANESNIYLFQPYYLLPIEKLYNKKVNSDVLTATKGTINPDIDSLDKHFSYIDLRDTPQQNIEILNKGKAKYFFANTFLSRYFAKTGKYNNISTDLSYQYQIPISIGISKDCSQELFTIIQKTLMSISNSQISAYFDSASTLAPPITLLQSIKTHPYQYLTILFGILLVFTLIVLLFVNERRKSHKAMFYDDVTGIWNVSMFDHVVTKKLSQATHPYALIQINISRFRFVNDTYSRDTGDEVLRLFATLLKNSFVQEDENYASMWADYFIAFVNFTTEKDLENRFEVFANSFQTNAEKICSFRFVLKAGIAVIRPSHDPDNLSSLLEKANHAMNSITEPFMSKAAFFTDVMKKELEEFKLVDSNMMSAFYKGEFQPFYQPKYDINTNQICGAEALIRWINPDKGLIRPDDFLPYFEKCGFIVDVDYYVYEKTCENMRHWLNEGIKVVPISCNFSRLHAKDDFFPEKVQLIADEYGIPHHLIEIEITENVAMEKLDIVLRHFKKFKEMGFIVSIDDFGSGYSSLALLEQMDIDVIKMDKSFLESNDISAREFHILVSLVHLAQKLGLTVICEGVETKQHVDILNEAGCFYAQGFYFSKPLPLSDFVQAIKENRQPDAITHPEDFEHFATDEEILEELSSFDEE